MSSNRNYDKIDSDAEKRIKAGIGICVEEPELDRHRVESGRNSEVGSAAGVCPRDISSYEVPLSLVAPVSMQRGKPPHHEHPIFQSSERYTKPFKAAYRRECDFFMKSQLSERITPYDVASLVKAFSSVASIMKPGLEQRDDNDDAVVTCIVWANLDETVQMPTAHSAQNYVRYDHYCPHADHHWMLTQTNAKLIKLISIVNNARRRNTKFDSDKEQAAPAAGAATAQFLGQHTKTRITTVFLHKV
ncbi:hypothetical protein EVAR_86005_1 [Eumeta japonica]|uniref:Uncharacterized protein n=1 Tax=Eumeta variegata TaxID=151549 RepID=A0A4C1UJ52_EUMVA|nr:hypothetical protein EVAR_86005_1 [Eumeta japonica]